MSTPLIKYPLDPSGISPNNAVIGEIRTLEDRPYRAFSPVYSPYFGASITIWDHITSRQLVEGEDYELSQLEQFPTMRFGKGIYRLVLITNPEVSNTVRYNYQTLGGLYHLDATVVAQLYEAYLNDDRPVPYDKVVGKPKDFPPSLHAHYLSEIHGFEPLIVALERLGDSITLGNEPAFNALIQWVQDRINNLDSLTEEELYAGTGLHKVITYGDLIKATQLLNYNTVSLVGEKSSMGRGGSQTLSVSLTHYDTTRPLYWAIEHITTDDSDFEYSSGILDVSTGQAEFTVKLVVPEEQVEESTYKIHIRRENSTGPILKSTDELTARYYDPETMSPGEDGEGVEDEWGYTHSGLGGNGKWTGSTEDYAVRLGASCCIFDPYVGVHPHSFFLMANK